MSLDVEKEDLSEVEERRKNQYISKRELYLVIPAVILVVFFGYLIFDYLRRNAEESVCNKNMKEIATALQLYLADNGDRYPPVFEAGEGGAPRIVNGAAVTWISRLSGYMTKRASFSCPSSKPVERVNNNSSPNVLSSYGFYRLWELQPQGFMADPSIEAIVGETSNRGSERSFDPVPFMVRGGPAPYDGFMIGWDTGNDMIAETSRYVTRLAFPGTASGRFEPDGSSRHASGVRVLLGDGHVRTIKPPEAKIQRTNKDAVGLWGER